MGSLKSQKIPEETRSTIMNLFRIPLNLVVVLVLIKMDSMSDITRFGVCGGMCLMGLIGTLFITTTAKGKGKKKVE
jgi:hypothetical protein